MSVLIGFEMYMNRSRMSNEKASRPKTLSTDILYRSFGQLVDFRSGFCILDVYNNMSIFCSNWT